MQHCPSQAYRLCCVWNSAPTYYYRYWIVASGDLFKYVPYTQNCYNTGDKLQDVVAKIDDVCGCTLNHEVTVETSSPYYGLKSYNEWSPKCK
jgi:hypothetical protein